jgi:diguanylate cyclase (GGDEF)-like protein
MSTTKTNGGRASPSGDNSSRLDALLGESPLAWALLALLLILPVAGALALLGLSLGTFEPDPAWMRGVGASLMAAGLTLALVVAWLMRGLRRQMVRLRGLAVTDLLTGVANLRLFVQALERELDLARRHGFPVSVVVINLDHFERVNREHGYAVGDQVLVLVAERLSEHLRDSDLLARTNGGEFALLLSHLDSDSAVAAARRFRTVVNWQPLPVGSLEISVSACYGVATYRGQKGLDCRTLMSHAEEAMRRARASGSDRVCSWKISAPEA